MPYRQYKKKIIGAKSIVSQPVLNLTTNLKSKRYYDCRTNDISLSSDQPLLEDKSIPPWNAKLIEDSSEEENVSNLSTCRGAQNMKYKSCPYALFVQVND